MHPRGILLCAIDTDDGAPDLVAAAHTWAAATHCRPEFVDTRKLGPATGGAADAVTAAAADMRPNLVLVASSTTAEGRLGDVPGDLLRTGRAPLVIVPPGAGAPPSGTPIVCAVSLGDHDEAALRFTRSLAAVSGRRLALRSVFDPQDAASSAAARARSSVAVPVGTDGGANGDHTADATRGGAAPEDDVAVRAVGLARRLRAVARDAGAGALVVASRPGDPVSHALEAGDLWAEGACAVVVVRP